MAATIMGPRAAGVQRAIGRCASRPAASPHRLAGRRRHDIAVRPQSKTTTTTTTTTRRSATTDASEANGEFAPFRSMSSPWEQEGKHELRRLGKLYKAVLKGPLQYSPIVLICFAFVPIAHSYLLLSVLESFGINLPRFLVGMVAKTPFAGTAVGSKVYGALSWLLELPPGTPGEEAWRVVLQTVIIFVPVLYLFVAVPVIDLLLGRDSRAQLANKTNLKETNGYSFVLWAYCFLFFGLFCMSAMLAPSLRMIQLVGLTISFGIYGGAYFTVGHELCHSTKRSEQILSQSMFALVCYMHWFCAHRRIHHKWVATAEDPTSAFKGESVYGFIPRSIFGQIGGAYNLEKSVGLRAIWAATPCLIAGALAVTLGAKAVVFYLGSALVAILQLEIVNYIEHYGLRRKRLASGRYEPTGVQHSWNADWLFSNCNMVDLQLHADHHTDSSRPFFSLRNIHEAPQMPAPYPVMMLMSLLPPLWFRVMDRRIEKYEEGNSQGTEAAATM